MAWPNHIRNGVSASTMIDTIITTAIQRIALGVDVDKYEQILGHAYLDRHNHRHGNLRLFVRPDGTGVNGVASLDEAWTHVQNALNAIVQPAPLTPQLLATVLNGIDHGGIG